MTERKKRVDPKDYDDRRRAPRHDAMHLGSVITRVIGGGEVKGFSFSVRHERNGRLWLHFQRLYRTIA